ncbi:MAG: hypothetical protein NTU80_11550 [Verrucomicrobia bacterium]|nr:hypothetical protein [Verrucomicrobiota bacterium]
MKASHLFFAGSVALNVAFIAANWHSSAFVAPVLKPAESPRTPTESLSASPGAQLNTPANSSTPQRKLESVRDFLLESGIPAEGVREVIQMLVWRKYDDQYRAKYQILDRSHSNKTWWKDDFNEIKRLKTPLNGDQQKEIQELLKAADAELENLLIVNDKLDMNPPNRFNFLPADKAKAISKLNLDYDYMISSIGNDNGDEGDSDQHKLDTAGESLRIIESERKRDINALLSPAEREAYDLRESDTAKNLRPLITALDATEAEYRSIFRLQQAFDEKYGVMNNPAADIDPARNEEAFKNRAAAENVLEAQIKALVGAERYNTAVNQQIKLDGPLR